MINTQGVVRRDSERGIHNHVHTHTPSNTHTHTLYSKLHAIIQRTVKWVLDCGSPLHMLSGTSGTPRKTHVGLAWNIPRTKQLKIRTIDKGSTLVIISMSLT